MNNLPIKVFKFTSCPDGYKCNHPGDCSGEYIGVLDYEEMEARAERAEEAWECSTARATLSLEPWGGPDGEEE